jgi:hypothetical protein
MVWPERIDRVADPAHRVAAALAVGARPIAVYATVLGEQFALVEEP